MKARPRPAAGTFGAIFSAELARGLARVSEATAGLAVVWLVRHVLG